MSEPTLAEIIRRAIDARLLDVNVSCTARVEKFTPGPPGPPVVDAMPVIRRALLDEEGTVTHEELPVIPNVPVIYPRGSGDSCAITWPLAKGDYVQLVFATQAFAQWRESGDISDPGDLRLHSLANPVAIPGIGPKLSTLPMDPAALVIEAPMVKVGPLAAEFVVLADKLVTAINGHSHTVPIIGPAGTTASTTPTTPITAADIQSTKLKAE